MYRLYIHRLLKSRGFKAPNWLKQNLSLFVRHTCSITPFCPLCRLTKRKKMASAIRLWRYKCTWAWLGRWDAWRSGWSSSETRWSVGSLGSICVRRPCSCAACPYWPWPRSGVTGRGTSCSPGCTACSAAGTIIRWRCTRTSGSEPGISPAPGVLSNVPRPYPSPWAYRFPVSIYGGGGGCGVRKVTWVCNDSGWPQSDTKEVTW